MRVLCHRQFLIQNQTADGFDRIRTTGSAQIRKRAAGDFSLWVLAFFISISPLAAQQPHSQPPDYSQDPEWFPSVASPYRSHPISRPDLTNTAAISRMIQDGKLRMSVAQLLSAVMENNLGILSSRFNRYFSQTDVLRAKAGGAPRGSPGVAIPSGLFGGALGAGLGNTFAGVSPANGPVISAAARDVFISPRGGFDPSLTMNFSLDRSNSPLNTLRVSGVSKSVTTTATMQSRYAQAFTSGTTFTVSFNIQRQSSNQRNLRFNPAYVPSFGVSVTQQLLSGFGYAATRRYLDVARNGKEVAREFFRRQVIGVLAEAQNRYWDLVAFRETVRAAEQAEQVALRLYEDNKKQAEIGTLAPLDVITAESEVASRRRDLIVAETNLRQAEVQLKTFLSKEIDPSLASAEIEPTDPLPEPEDSDIPPLPDALASSFRNRPELAEAQGNILNEEIAVKFTENSLKPNLFLFGFYNSSSLYGSRLIPGVAGAPDAFISGGLSGALSQLARFQHPEYAFGIALTIPIKNRSAQADNLRARLEQRQAETTLQRTRNQISLEVRNAVIALEQAKSQVQAARKVVEFSAQSLDAEQKKLNAGVSIPYNVILVQRDLLAAQLAEVRARTNYAKARVELDRATGVTLEKNNIDPAEVPRGDFSQTIARADHR